MSGLDSYEKDVIKTTSGNLFLYFLGHGSLFLQFNNKNIYIDVYGEVADYSMLPKADFIFLTHEHYDHMDSKSIKLIRTDKTTLVYTETCAREVPDGFIMHNGETHTFQGIQVEAVPAYNITHKRDNGEPFHVKGIGNGYVFTFGDKRIYVAGDTEDIPELKNLNGIDIAFLPMNLPYTMTPEMTAKAAKSFHPHILYPYHFGKTDASQIGSLLKSQGNIEVRIRKMS